MQGCREGNNVTTALDRRPLACMLLAGVQLAWHCLLLLRRRRRQFGGAAKCQLRVQLQVAQPRCVWRLATLGDAAMRRHRRAVGRRARWRVAVGKGARSCVCTCTAQRRRNKSQAVARALLQVQRKCLGAWSRARGGPSSAAAGCCRRRYRRRQTAATEPPGGAGRMNPVLVDRVLHPAMSHTVALTRWRCRCAKSRNWMSWAAANEMDAAEARAACCRAQAVLPLSW